MLCSLYSLFCYTSLHVIDNTTSGQDITCIISVIDNTTSGQDITCIISVIDNTTSGQDITCIITCYRQYY